MTIATVVVELIIVIAIEIEIEKICLKFSEM